uniref:Interleukin-12 subunit beta n=1 Tax=Takifugu rubripes TaxID=31033 RepID=Q800F2_TAKRU|nr:interleukin 12 beta chain precursor [Takifugu rubripes]CAD69011.1 interleukin 12 beta chain precursor [Takifugu rubripes]
MPGLCCHTLLNTFSLRWVLLPVLVVQTDGSSGQLLLSCLTSTPEEEHVGGSPEDVDIFWKNNGVMETQRGNLYVVDLEESLGGGNYTCHSQTGSLLNYTVVLIKEDNDTRKKILLKNDQGQYLSCSANNFNGDFRCSWSWHAILVGKVAFITAQRQDSPMISIFCSAADGSLPACSVDAMDDGDGGMWCKDEQHCPYAEESQPIHIDVHVSSKHFLMQTYSSRFFLSDIGGRFLGPVKPDKVIIRKVNATMVAWSYPSSWNTPFSYFPLTFQIRQLRKSCRTCDHPCTQTRVTKVGLTAIERLDKWQKVTRI